MLENLCPIQGALLYMNRSIKAERTFRIIKNKKSHKKLRRKMIKKLY